MRLCPTGRYRNVLFQKHTLQNECGFVRKWFICLADVAIPPDRTSPVTSICCHDDSPIFPYYFLVVSRTDTFRFCMVRFRHEVNSECCIPSCHYWLRYNGKAVSHRMVSNYSTSSYHHPTQKYITEYDVHNVAYVAYPCSKFA